jgi:hybrid cluster-associated redox disulfide protein
MHRRRRKSSKCFRAKSQSGMNRSLAPTIDPAGEDVCNWTIDLLLKNRPEAWHVLLRYGMACVGCVMAPFETVAEAAREYRVDLCALVKELHEVCGAPRQSPRSRGRRRFPYKHGENGAGS